MIDKEQFLKQQSYQWELMESLKDVSSLLEELQEIKKSILELNKGRYKEFIRADEVEYIYGIKRSSLHNYVEMGDIPKHKIRGLTLYKVSEIEEAIQPAA